MDRRYRSGRWPWVLIGTLAGLAVLAGLVLAVWKLPPVLYGDVTQASPDARLQAASSFRTALVAGLASLAALGGLATAARTYRLTQQGQLTERYTKAIEQLGNDKLDVRLGGIYALERIAVDSERDHPTVVEVLSAFVREHGQPAIQPSLVDDGDANGEPTSPSPRPSPPTDVQAAVTVLGRLPRRKDVSRGDLAGAHLAGAALDGAHLEGANLINAHLEGATLSEAHLEQAMLAFAYLKGAWMSKAHLEGAYLGSAHLEEADLREAHLEGANLEPT
jgi:hypothetical protein